jgi:hypothetical protein
MDSDGQFDPEDLEGLVQAQLEHPNAVVLGYRQRRADPTIRRMNAFGWKQVIRVSLGLRGIRDIDCGFKLFPTHVIQACAVSARGAMVSAELLTKLQRMHVRIVQVPVQHLPRQYGQATGANLRVILRAFGELRQVMSYLHNWEAPAVVASDWAGDRGGPYTAPVTQPETKKGSTTITRFSAARSRVLSRIPGAGHLFLLFLCLSLLTVLPGSAGLHTAHAQATSQLATPPYHLSNASDTINEMQLSTTSSHQGSILQK